MANTDIVRGFKLVGTLHGRPAQIRRYFIDDSTATFIGDAVKVGGGSDAAGTTATVAQAAATNAILGVMVGVDKITGVADADLNLYATHRPASKNMYVWVCDDPDAIYEIQEDGVGATIAAGDIGLNADIVVAAGSATTGMSGMEVDIESKLTTATLQVKILGLVDRADNELAANAKLLVKINNHQYGSHTGTAGV